MLADVTGGAERVAGKPLIWCRTRHVGTGPL